METSAVSRRSRILSAAASLFASRGYDGTSVDEIANLAGVAKGTVFYNFGNKQTLAEQMVAEATRRLHEAIEREAPAAAAGPPRVRAILRALLGEISANPDFAAFVVTEVFRTRQNWAAALRLWRASVTTPLVEELRAGDPALSPRAAAIRATSLIGGTLSTGLYWMTESPTLSIDDVAAELFRSFGLDPAEASSSPAAAGPVSA